MMVAFLWLGERAAFVLRIAFKLYRFNFTSSGLEANGPWKYDLKIVLVCIVVITFSLDACFGLGFHFLLSLLFDKSFFLDDGSCDFLLNWKLFLSTFELVNVLAYRESFFARKRRDILSGLEQAQGAPHGSVHPEDVHAVILVWQVTVFWRQEGEGEGEEGMETGFSG